MVNTWRVSVGRSEMIWSQRDRREFRGQQCWFCNNNIACFRQTMTQNQLIKGFLASLLSFESQGYISNSTLQQSLGIFRTTFNLNLQFPKQLVSRLLTTLIIQFRKISKLPITTESDLLYQKSGQKCIQEYLLIQYLSLLETTLSLFQRVEGNLPELKQLLLILIASLIEKIKTSQAEYLLSLLKLLDFLLQVIVEKEREVNMLEMIFPNVVSNLFNLVVQFPIKSNKVSEIVFRSLGTLISKLFQKKSGNVLAEKKLVIADVITPKSDFKSVCLAKIQHYLQIIVDHPHSFDQTASVRLFIKKLVEAKGLQNTPVLNLVFKLAYLLDLEETISVPSTLTMSYLRSQAQKHLKFLNKNKDHYDSKLTSMYYSFSLKVIGLTQTITSHQTKSIYTILKSLFKLNTNLVKSAASHNYSLLIVHSQLSLDPPLQTDLQSTLSIFNNQFLSNNVAAFQNQRSNQNPIRKHIQTWNYEFVEQLVQYLNEDILSNPYSTTMSVSSFKKYLESIIMLKQFIFRVENQSLLETIFEMMRKSQCLGLLQPSNQEQEFLIAFSYDIMVTAYQKLEIIKQGFQRLNLKIQFIETTISLFTIQNNTITTYCNYYLLKQSSPLRIGKFVYPLLPTLVYRNQYNLLFIEKAIQLCDTFVTSIYAQHIYEVYNTYSNVQKIILTVLPNLSTETIRRAVLSISTKHKWIDALNSSLLNLNNRPLSKQQSDSFNPNDSDNVVIKNCLGVVLIEIEQRFKVELQSNPSKILDLLNRIFQVNSKMIFCSKLHEYFPLLIKLLDCQSPNKLTYSKVGIVGKVLKLLGRYFEEYGEEKINHIMKEKQQLAKVFARLGEQLERKLELDETMTEVLENSFGKLNEVCKQLFTLNAKSPRSDSLN